MRALKLILTGLFTAIALAAGFVVAAVVAVIGLAIFLSGRLLGKPKVRTANSRPRRQSSSMGTSDAIDVTATEIPIETSAPSQNASLEHERIRA